jgi:hypothetical protein
LVFPVVSFLLDFPPIIGRKYTHMKHNDTRILTILIKYETHAKKKYHTIFVPKFVVEVETEARSL